MNPLRNYLYNETFFLTKKELVHVSSIRSTTAEGYQPQSKQARSGLSHEANNQYGEGILERCCCVWGPTCIKMPGIAMCAIYRRGADSWQRFSTTANTNISHRNYFASSFIHCRKYFAVSIICCTKIFAKFIFVALNNYENILITKISRFTVTQFTKHSISEFFWCIKSTNN